MIIANVGGGFGNQLFTYAVARRLAYKLGVELKLQAAPNVQLNLLNIEQNLATPEDIELVDKIDSEREIPIGKEGRASDGQLRFMPQVLDYPDNVNLRGNWQSEKYFADIADVIRSDCTLKELGGPITQAWLEKIRAADCPVSLHVRHGDYIISYFRLIQCGTLPVDYYRHCVETLKAQLGSFTLFVFSDDLDWCKKNFHFAVPIHFVEGCERDIDEMFLMSQCKHNIIAHSTFSWWGAWLNANPDKKVFAPEPWIKNGRFNKDIYPDGWTRVPVDFNKPVEIDMPPVYSIVIVVEDDIGMIRNCLASVKSQLFQYYEVIIIDDCSTDGSSYVCQQEIVGKKNMRLVQLKRRIGRHAAWNMGLDMAQGEYVMFLKGSDRILPTTFFLLQNDLELKDGDIFHSIINMFEQTPGKNQAVGLIDIRFKGIQGMQPLELTKIQQLEYLFTRQLNQYLGTKIFRRRFLLENYIRMNDRLGSCAELIFLVECLMKTSKVFLTSQAFYLRADAANPAFVPLKFRDLNELLPELYRVLSSIEDVNARKRLIMQFVLLYSEQR